MVGGKGKEPLRRKAAGDNIAVLTLFVVPVKTAFMLASGPKAAAMGDGADDAECAIL